MVVIIILPFIFGLANIMHLNEFISKEEFMKNLDFRSVLIGILSSALIFTLLGMHLQDENLGDITVRSITIEAEQAAPFIVMNEDGGGIVIGFDDVYNGLISIYSSKGSELVYIGAAKGNSGSIETFSSDGSKLISIGSSGTSGEADGSISIFNRHNKSVVLLQGNKDADGVIALSDRYGDLGWFESGKK